MKYPNVKMIAEQIADSSIIDDAKSTDQIILRQAIIAEYDAVNLYEQMAASTKDERIRKIMFHVAQEEKVHIGEFEALLDEVDKEHTSSVEDGKQEAADH